MKDGSDRALEAVLRGDPGIPREVTADPEAFLAVCLREDLAALVYHRLARHADQVPHALIVELRRRSREAAARELVLQREAIRVLDALGTRGVQPILFKGTALAYSAYPDPSLRARCDTDLLIREMDIPPVRHVMTQLGFHSPVQCDGEVLFRQFEMTRTDALGIVHAFDCHWRVSTQSVFADLCTYEDAFRQAIAAPALGRHGLVMGSVDALLLALVHPVMHHRGEDRWLWLYDVHLLASQLDRAAFVDLADRAVDKRIAAICTHGLRAARTRLGTRVPDDVLQRLDAVPAGSEPSAAFLAPGRRWTDETLSNLRGLGAWRDRWRLVREIALPSPAYMLRAYGLVDSGIAPLMLPALYVHRAFRGVWRVASGAK